MSDAPSSTRNRDAGADPADPLPEGCGLAVDHVDYHVHFAHRLPVVYVENNKAACSTVKYSLLRSILPEDEISDGALHWRQEGPFARLLSGLDGAEAAEVVRRPAFTVVRNPYVRILSAYLDKLTLELREGRQFYGRFFLRPDAGRPLDFVEFLRCIASDHPRRCDAHFAPQYVNTLAHHVDYDFIGSVEEFGATADYLDRHGVALTPWRQHATGAAGLLDEHFTAEAVALADRIFDEDFRMFGYPRGLARAHEPPARGRGERRRGVGLVDFLADPKGCAQTGTREVEAMRRFERSTKAAERRAIAEEAVAFRDWRIVKRLAAAMLAGNALEAVYPLLDRLTLLLTGHMDHLPEELLSARGRTLKRRRAEILAR